MILATNKKISTSFFMKSSNAIVANLVPCFLITILLKIKKIVTSPPINTGVCRLKIIK
jgi:hypothetical protein